MVEPPGGYVPARGEAVWIRLHPQAGHEQAGRRPAVVLSPAACNGRVGLAVHGRGLVEYFDAAVKNDGILLAVKCKCYCDVTSSIA